MQWNRGDPGAPEREPEAEGRASSGKETDSSSPLEEATASRVTVWTRRLNRSDNALWVLFWASVAETIIVPIPIELVLIPFMITNRHRLWTTAAMVTAGCLLASLIGYGVGYLFFDTIGRDIIGYFEWSDQLDQFRSLFTQYGFWAIVAVGVIPIPFQIAMLAAGAAGYSIILFVVAATIARGFRYFGLALLVYFFGKRAEELWRRHKTNATLLAGAAIIIVAAATLSS
jgi:membrane protein YqaA with SNARE-associated domain